MRGGSVTEELGFPHETGLEHKPSECRDTGGKEAVWGESEWGLGSEGRGRHALWPARPGEGADAVRSSVETVAGERRGGREKAL